jgi:hypothetical protein
MSKAIKLKLIHKGIRPLHSLTVLDFKKKIYYEEYPDETFRLWNKRMLNSGCDNVISSPKELMECYYCPKCDEYFSKDQWEEIE